MYLNCNYPTNMQFHNSKHYLIIVNIHKFILTYSWNRYYYLTILFIGELMVELLFKFGPVKYVIVYYYNLKKTLLNSNYF